MSTPAADYIRVLELVDGICCAAKPLIGVY